MDVQYLRQMSPLTFEWSRSKFKVKTAELNTCNSSTAVQDIFTIFDNPAKVISAQNMLFDKVQLGGGFVVRVMRYTQHRYGEK